MEFRGVAASPSDVSNSVPSFEVGSWWLPRLAVGFHHSPGCRRLRKGYRHSGSARTFTEYQLPQVALDLDVQAEHRYAPHSCQQHSHFAQH
jgi:hypothetical protein